MLWINVELLQRFVDGLWGNKFLTQGNVFALCVNKFLGQMNDYLICSNNFKTQKNVAAIHGIVFPEYCNKFLRLKQSRLGSN